MTTQTTLQTAKVILRYLGYTLVKTGFGNELAFYKTGTRGWRDHPDTFFTNDYDDAIGTARQQVAREKAAQGAVA